MPRGYRRADMATGSKKPKGDAASEYIHVRISPELKAKLLLIAKGGGMDLSNYCRAAMIEKAKREGHKI
jgi:tartrate dehydratase alpha subunit/fumarate hydratase class I-like protein